MESDVDVLIKFATTKFITVNVGFRKPHIRECKKRERITVSRLHCYFIQTLTVCHSTSAENLAQSKLVSFILLPIQFLVTA